jgi:hypothetical protein
MVIEFTETIQNLRPESTYFLLLDPIKLLKTVGFAIRYVSATNWFAEARIVVSLISYFQVFYLVKFSIITRVLKRVLFSVSQNFLLK